MDDPIDAMVGQLRHRARQNAIVRHYRIEPSSRPEDDQLDLAAADRIDALMAEVAELRATIEAALDDLPEKYHDAEATLERAVSRG